MQDADRKEFDRQIQKLGKAFGKDKVERETVKVYFDALGDQSLKWVCAGATRMLQYRGRDKGFPTPGDWRTAIEEAYRAHQEREQHLEAKAIGKDAARKFIAAIKANVKNPMQQWQPSTDTERQGAHYFRELLHQAHGALRDNSGSTMNVTLDSAAVRALEQFGGLAALGLVDAENVLAARQTFARLYAEGAGEPQVESKQQ